MEREQAVNVLKEVLENFSGKWIDSFKLCNSNLNSRNDYFVEIKGTINESSRKIMDIILEDYGLCAEGENRIIIYSPSPVE